MTMCHPCVSLQTADAAAIAKEKNSTSPIIVSQGEGLCVFMSDWAEWEISSGNIVEAILLSLAACYASNTAYSDTSKFILLFFQVS